MASQMAGATQAAPLVEEVEEDLPNVFTFHVALTHSSTYYRWRHIGVTQQLATDEEIACFLLECYDKVVGIPACRGVCATCQSPLGPQCVKCGVTNSQHSAANTEGSDMNSEDSADSFPHSVTTSDPESEEKECEDSVGTRTGRRKTSPIQRKSQPADSSEHPQKLTSTECVQPSQELDQRMEQTVKQESAPEQAVEEEHNADLAVQQSCSNDHGMQGHQLGQGLCEQDQSRSPTASSSQLLSEQRKRRRKKREFTFSCLDCWLCGKKLSSKHSVVRHIKCKHPETDLSTLILNKSDSESEDMEEMEQSDSQRDGDEHSTKCLEVSKADITRSGTSLARDTQNTQMTALDPSSTQNPVRVKMKRSKRPDLDSLLCPTCGVKFENRNRLYHHHRRCAWKVCHLCGKSVKNLDNHLMRHNAPRRFPCKHCPKGFISRGRLRAHLRRHKGERTFCCEICGKCFFERGPLAEHLLLHAGSKPFKCHLCDSAFTRGRGLKDHMRVHTGEKPYKCHICNRPFSSTGNLAAHRRKVHKMEPLLPFGAQKLTCQL